MALGRRIGMLMHMDDAPLCLVTGATGYVGGRLVPRCWRGMTGQAYWWSVWPFHGLVFSSMQRNIARAAEELETSLAQPSGPRDRVNT